MTLLEYVINNSKEIDKLQCNADIHNQTLREVIIEEVCPAYFDILKGSPYYKPLRSRKGDADNCVHNDGTSNKKCTECWNREVLYGS